MSKLNLAVLALTAACLTTGGASAAGRTYAVVVKALDNAFNIPIEQGCKAAAAELTDVECLYVGPAVFDEAKQIQLVRDMITKGVDGLAVSAANPAAMVQVLKEAQQAGIPVVTFDSDLLPEDAAYRASFIGTDNYEFGAELARQTIALGKTGGLVCIQTGAAASVNLNERVQGIRDTLAGVAKDAGVDRLTGQNGWTEPDNCPVFNNDDVTLAAQQVADVLTAVPDLGAFIAVGGWAQYAPTAYKNAVETVKARVDSKDLVIAFGDTFEPQMPLLAAGLSNVNVGQKPYEMGKLAIQSLDTLVNGGTVEPVQYTAFEICFPETADTCGK